jgi:hypothetical protein
MAEEKVVVVKHKSSGCITCLVILLILFIGLPVLAFAFKIAFLVAIFEAIKEALGL